MQQAPCAQKPNLSLKRVKSSLASRLSAPKRCLKAQVSQHMPIHIHGTNIVLAECMFGSSTQLCISLGKLCLHSPLLVNSYSSASRWQRTPILQVIGVNDVSSPTEIKSHCFQALAGSWTYPTSFTTHQVCLKRQGLGSSLGCA